MIGILLTKSTQIVKLIPIHTNGLKRKLKLKRLKKIKNIRFDNVKVISEAIKTSSWMIIFILMIFIVIYNHLTLPINKDNKTIELVISMPLFIIEFIYLYQNQFYKDIIKFRDRLSLTKHRKKNKLTEQKLLSFYISNK